MSIYCVKFFSDGEMVFLKNLTGSPSGGSKNSFSLKCRRQVNKVYKACLF